MAELSRAGEAHFRYYPDLPIILVMRAFLVALLVGAAITTGFEALSAVAAKPEMPPTRQVDQRTPAEPPGIEPYGY